MAKYSSKYPIGRILGFSWLIVLAVLSYASVGSATGGNFVRNINYQNLSRWYLVHVPPGYSRQVATPVVLVLHGGGGNPYYIWQTTGMSNVANNNTFIAVYPAGTTGPNGSLGGFLWNDGRPYVNGTYSPVDDVGFIVAVLNDLARILNIDRSRIYASGFSNGALMCYRLAQQLPDQIAAIAAVAGQRAVDEIFPPPPWAVPLIHFHGLLDTIAPYFGGKSSVPSSMVAVFEPVPDTVASWATHDGCCDPVEILRINKAVKTVYTPCPLTSEVVLWTLEDGGHTWPGESTGTHVNRDISASQEIWDFFKTKSKYTIAGFPNLRFSYRPRK